MKPKTPKKPVLATLLAVLPFDEVEVDEGADEVPVMVALVHETFDGIVKLFDSVRSEHCRRCSTYRVTEGRQTYLIEGTIASIENILKGDVGTVLNTTNVCTVEVKRDAKPAFARTVGKVPHDLLSSRGIGEIVEGRRVLYSRNYNGDCITMSSKHETWGTSFTYKTSWDVQSSR